MSLDEARNELISFFGKSREWLLITPTGKSLALTSDEIELAAERGKILFSFQTAQGFQTWRVVNFKFEKQKIYLDLSRNFGTETTEIEIVPRASVAEFAAAVELARIEKATKIAKLIVEKRPALKLIRVALKHENGRLAQIFVENSGDAQTAVFTDVSGTLTAERILTTAIIELEKLRARKRKPVEKIWILAERKIARNLQRLLVLLKRNWKAGIEIYEIFSDESKKQNLLSEPLPNLEMNDLWRGKTAQVSALENKLSSDLSKKITALAPENIDAIFTARGETVRFAGLPFVRLRNLGGAEKAWFGIETKRQILNENTACEFAELLDNLKIHRRFNAPNKRHAFYTLAPEAWLESILRRDISRLDANLILSPLHHQFRAGRERIDLLALRTDGRLVIIELKAAADREMIFQAADYWRKIESERRTQRLQKAKIFGDLEIKDEPALIYLVAPMLEFHHSFRFLATTIAAEIEIYRFDINQNWRENLRIVRQEKTDSG